MICVLNYIGQEALKTIGYTEVQWIQERLQEADTYRYLRQINATYIAFVLLHYKTRASSYMASCESVFEWQSMFWQLI